MITCSSCGVARSYVGVLFPARLTCPCEMAPCNSCEKDAVGVEFQRPIKEQEPNDKTYWCVDHKPGDFHIASTQWSLTDDEPKTKRKKREPEKSTGRPRIDPAWGDTLPPPPGSSDANKVQCAVCRDTHAMRDRVMHNGTHSSCPKCFELITVFADMEG